MTAIDKMGRFEGYQSFLIKNILWIETETDYLKSIEFLYSEKFGTREEDLCQIKGKKPKADILEFARETQSMVSAFILDSNNKPTRGIIEKITEAEIKMQTIGSSGEYAGVLWLPISAITSVRIGGIDERCFELKHKNYESFRSLKNIFEE